MIPRFPINAPAIPITESDGSPKESSDLHCSGFNTGTGGVGNPLYRRPSSPSPLQIAARASNERKKLTQNTHAELNLHTQLTSPIKHLSQEEAISAIMELSSEAWQWKLAPVPYPARPEAINKRDWQHPKRTDQEIWNHRIIEVRGYLSLMFQNSKRYQAISYPVDNKNIGILLYSSSPASVYIGYFVTHPGSEGAGSALIEEAINISEGMEKNGKLELFVENPDAFKTYEHFGFRPELNGVKMTLDPADSDGKWIRNSEQKWVLSKYLDKKYII